MKPISRTAFYCCGIRMEDAESARPICGDTHARLFMDDEGLRVLGLFREDARAKLVNVTRHRVIDDILRRELSLDPRLRVVIVGAGFDSRAYRLPGGTWIELDEPQVIAHKDGRLAPAACPNALHRIAIDFSVDSLEDKLAPFARPARAVVVVEGVLFYLEEPQILELVRCLRATFPRHLLVCDLMSRKFLERYARPVQDKIAGLGATLYAMDRPEEIFQRCGYRLRDRTSVVARGRELAADPPPATAVTDEDRKIAIEGYSICELELG